MNKPQQNLNHLKNTILTFNGHEHDFIKVLAAAKAGPMIEINVSDILVVAKDPADAIVIEPADEAIDNHTLSLYKRNGVYLVLTGKNWIAHAKANNRAVVKANFVSVPALKQTRTLADQQAAARSLIVPNEPIRYVPPHYAARAKQQY